MNVEFEEFARVVSEREHGSSKTGDAKAIKRVTVLGGGVDAQVYAARALAAGCEVSLFSAYGAELDRYKNGGSIALRGDGPIGNYNVNQSGVSSIRTSSSLDQVIETAELLIITGPVHKQRTYAMALAEHFVDGQIIFLPNARSFGAIEMAWLMKTGGCRADLTIIDMPGAPFFVEETREGLVVSDRPNPCAATLPAGRVAAFDAIAPVVGAMNARPSALASGFIDGSGIVDIAALLLGGAAAPDARPEVVMGGTPLATNDSFRNRLGSSHQALIEGAWNERVEVARRFGVREMPSLDTMIDFFAGASEGSGARAVPDAECAKALLRDAATGSLAPLLSSANLAGVDAPLNQSLMTLVSQIEGSDLYSVGRHLDRIGIHQDNINDARKAIDALMIGGQNG